MGEMEGEIGEEIRSEGMDEGIKLSKTERSEGIEESENRKK